jgi:undecaprenyl-diphosphatase
LSTLEALILGIVQGLTEFLPISSSGHLVLMQHLFGFNEPELLLDTCLHIGTLLAVVVVFWPEIRTIVATLWRLPLLLRSAGGAAALFRSNGEVRICGLIVAGSIPTALLGVVFHRAAERIFASVPLVGFMLLVTGSLLWLTGRVAATERPLLRMTVKDALWIGLSQGIAILPGISRSGATISTALYLGIDRKLAGRFSFLLSIPAIAGALLLQIFSSELHTAAAAPAVLLGSTAAAVSGYLALKVLLRLVERGRIRHFAPYCWLLGTAALLWSLAIR